MKTTLALVALSLVLMTVSVYADGMIIPEPMPPHPHPTMLEVKYHNVDISIDNQYADTKIDQTFHNPNPWDIEGTYLFPLPEGASIQKFSMFVNGQELTGEVLDAGEARHIYEDLVRKMIDPGLLEYVDRNTFKARVYPIEANSDKKVNLEYSELISCESGICEYTYPLNTEKFSSKDLDSVAITVKIKSNVPIKNIYSPSHEIDIDRKSDREVEVSYEARNVKPDTDFKLIYTVSQDDIGVNLISYKEGDTGYFLLMMAPKIETGGGTVSKDIVFVLDKSGSMAGDKIEQAKDALGFCLKSLNTGDKFGIVTFSTGITSYKEELQTVAGDSTAISQAVGFVNEIKALGGTDIEGALLEAMQLMPNDGRPKIIVFITDGEPTVGVTDIGQILDDVSGANTEGTKIFVFGVGYDVNTFLLDRLANDNHGASEYVVEGESIETKVSNFYEKIDSPVMSDVDITFSGVPVMELYPKEIPDIFKGSQVLVFGQYKTGGRVGIELSGKVYGTQSTLRYSLTLPSAEDENGFLPRLWATRKIGYLLDEIRLQGEDDELVDEIVALSKKYGIATPYTSFLILEDEPTPAGRDRLYEAMAPSTGANAVDTSQSLSGFKAASAAGGAQQDVVGPGGQTTTIKYVGSKTFIEKDGVLTDTEYVEGSETRNLRYGSDAYFETLAVNPVLGQYFAIGKNVIVCEGVCIKVTEDYSGAEQVIGKMEVGWEGIREAGCQSDSDCELSCACTCGKPGSIQCIRAADCPKEQGITGCKCESGVCTPITSSNWQPPAVNGTGPGPGTGDSGLVCGDGICAPGESCATDCTLADAGSGSITKQGRGELEMAIIIVMLGIIAGVLVFKSRMREGKPPAKNNNEPLGRTTISAVHHAVKKRKTQDKK